MASPLAIGAGASEGLDTMLRRMLAEAAQAESVRSNQAEEALKRRTLDQNEPAIRALGEERQATSAARARALADEDRQQAEEDRMLADPNTPPAVRTFIGMHRAMPKGTTVPYQLITEPNGPQTSNEMKTVLYKGKPVDANYDPKTKVLTYQGQDITKEAGHYEKPPAPDRVLIQSGEGYVPRADAAATLRAGGSVPLATTSSTRTMSEGAKMLQPHIDDLAQQADALDKAGLFGPVMSRVRDIMSKVGTIDDFGAAIESDPELNKDEATGRFATSIGLLASGAGRVHGGARGGGNSQMYNNFKAMLSDASTLPMFKGRLAAVNDYMKGYAAGPGGAKPTGGTGLPEVGGQFGGGKVLKVTPIK